MLYRRKIPQLLFVTIGICFIFLHLIKIENHGNKTQHSNVHTNNRFEYLDRTISPKLPDNVSSNENMPLRVTVNVNNLQEFQGLKIKNEVYVPFTFLSKYYGVIGKFVNSNEFRWYHVNPTFINLNLHYPKYSVHGEYLTFQRANVPKRARVKCICGRFEIPISTQWDPKGYYYPTQIAQYGLSYLSRYHIEPKKRTIRRLNVKGNTIEGSEIPAGLFILKLKFKSNHCPFKVKVVASDGNSYILSYVTENSMIDRKGNVIIHGIGVEFESENKVLTRDLNSDILKGLSYQPGQRNGKTVLVNVESIQQITLENKEELVEARLHDVDHKSKFLAAANWFVRFQDEDGGWKVNLKRIIRSGMEAKAGWYSAMGQGQAISLLSRVFLITKKERYLNAALKATKVFHKNSLENGVRADLFGLPWYEEYPTQPPSFVLNGFVYSLFGLYDLWKVAGNKKGDDARILFMDGFQSLEKRIPLYDNGYNTFYDLRHITMPGISPNRARWQYHQIHLEQLYAIISIKDSPILNEVLKRWLGYVSGVLSRHN